MSCSVVNDNSHLQDPTPGQALGRHCRVFSQMKPVSSSPPNMPLYFCPPPPTATRVGTSATLASFPCLPHARLAATWDFALAEPPAWSAHPHIPVWLSPSPPSSLCPPITFSTRPTPSTLPSCASPFTPWDESSPNTIYNCLLTVLSIV